MLWICVLCFVFFFKQKTAYEMRISDWSSDVCSSDLNGWNIVISRPWSRTMLPTSSGVPSKARKSVSKISTPSKPAAAMAASFSWRSPLIDTVAIEVFTVPLLLCASAPTSVVRQAIGSCDEAQHHVHRVPTQACELLLCAEVASEDLGESRAEIGRAHV